MREITFFKQYYVALQTATDQLSAQVSQKKVDVALVEQLSQYVDAMLAMLPFAFPVKNSEWESSLPINPADAEDTPKQPYPPGTKIVYESNVRILLEDWKFRIWNFILSEIPDNTEYQQRYLEPVLMQAEKCIALFMSAERSYWHEWEKDMVSLEANAVGWFTYLYHTDKERLEHALAILDKGYAFAGFRYPEWNNRNYIHDTKVRLLLKLNREEQAYAIVYQTLTAHPEYTALDDLKNTEPYLHWVRKQKKQEEATARKAKKEKKALEQLVKEEQAKVLNQFLNPEHPLVTQHADTLNLIKQRMLAVRLRRRFAVAGWEKMQEKADHEPNPDYILNPWSVQEIKIYESEHEVRLPDEVKVYLMEIGEGGEGYFCNKQPIAMERQYDPIQAMRLPFPITSARIHDINHPWGIKAWVPLDNGAEKEENLEELIHYLKKKKILHKNNSLRELFAVPVFPDRGFWCLGLVAEQDPLLVVMNGEFEGEVWIDSLHYGVEDGGYMGPATPEHRKFLSFIAGSVLANLEGGTNTSEVGEWL